MKRALEARGYTVIDVQDGEEALEVYGANQDEVSLIISDLVMPKLDGRQLAETLRASGCDVPILLASGYPPSDGVASFPPGVRFLQKPWTLRDLFAEVRALMDA